MRDSSVALTLPCSLSSLSSPSPSNTSYIAMSTILKDRSNSPRKEIKKLVLVSNNKKKSLFVADINDTLTLLQQKSAITCLKRIQHPNGAINNKTPTRGSFTNRVYLKNGVPVLSITTDSTHLDNSRTPHDISFFTDEPLFDQDQVSAAQKNILKAEPLDPTFAHSLGEYLTEQEQLGRNQTLHTLMDDLDTNKEDRFVSHTNWNPMKVPLFPIKRSSIACANCQLSHDQYIKKHPVRSFDKPMWRVCKTIPGDPLATEHKQVLYCPKCVDEINHNENAYPHNNNLLPVIWAPPRFLRDNYQPMFIGGDSFTHKYYTGSKSNSHWLEHIPSKKDLTHSPTTNFDRGHGVRNDNIVNVILRKGRA